jgi:hypothetical protein
MKYILYPFRFIILTLIVFPIWIFICVAELLFSIFANLFFAKKFLRKLKYRNNIKMIFKDFLKDLHVILYLY